LDKCPSYRPGGLRVKLKGNVTTQQKRMAFGTKYDAQKKKDVRKVG